MEIRNNPRPVIVAVDGPAGSGKSSVCAQVAAQLGWDYINTGIIYRALAYIARQTGVALAEPALMAMVDSFAREIAWQADDQTLWWKGLDLTTKLVTAEAGKDASFVAKMPAVRENLLPLQRNMALLSRKGAIVDGRDIGTVVFPDADLKVFMTASLEERAKRRHDQLCRMGGTHPDLTSLQAEIAARDDQDSARGAAPLKQAEGAVLFETSGMPVNEVIARFVAMLRDRQLA